MNKKQFDITGMTCAACAAHVEHAAKKVAGVTAATVNLLSNRLTVECDETVPDDAVIDAVQKAGYGAAVRSETTAGAPPSTNAAADKTRGVTDGKKQRKAALIRLWCSLGFLVLLMYVSMGHMIRLPLPPFMRGTPNLMVFALVQFC